MRNLEEINKVMEELGITDETSFLSSHNVDQPMIPGCGVTGYDFKTLNKIAEGCKYFHHYAAIANMMKYKKRRYGFYENSSFCIITI